MKFSYFGRFTSISVSHKISINILRFHTEMIIRSNGPTCNSYLLFYHFFFLCVFLLLSEHYELIGLEIFLPCKVVLFEWKKIYSGKYSKLYDNDCEHVKEKKLFRFFFSCFSMPFYVYVNASGDGKNGSKCE